MSEFKETFLRLSTDYANANHKAFDQTPIEKTTTTYNVRIANKARKKIDELCRVAKENKQLHEIEQFMNHENKYIRCLSAMYCLFTNPLEAEKVLEQLMQLPTPNAVGAQAMTILEVWRKGLMIW